MKEPRLKPLNARWQGKWGNNQPCSGGKAYLSEKFPGRCFFYCCRVHLGTKINDASQEVRSKINAITGDMPKECDEPIIQKKWTRLLLLLSLFLSNQKPWGQKGAYNPCWKRVREDLKTPQGVGKVNLIGESKREVNIWLDPVRLESLGLGVNEVIQGLQQGKCWHTPWKT